MLTSERIYSEGNKHSFTPHTLKGNNLNFTLVYAVEETSSRISAEGRMKANTKIAPVPNTFLILAETIYSYLGRMVAASQPDDW